MSPVSILTGEIQSGKTRFCQEVAEAARQGGWQVGGLLSPAVFQAGQKTAIDVLDLKTSQRRRLAELKGVQSSGLETKRWAFLPDAVEWGNQALAQALPCDLLLVDELGPLEFYQGQGWVNAFQAIEDGRYRGALVVIRPSLLEEAHRRWEVIRTVVLGDPDRDDPLPEDLLRELVGG